MEEQDKINIFILDNDPCIAAVSLCDKHLVKMILESAQMLCSPYEPNFAPYKRTHYNHPCSIWARECRENYDWLCEHALALCEEYTRFYGRRHKSEDVIDWCIRNAYILGLPRLGARTPFAQAMPDEYKKEDAVAAYRGYYIGEKADLAKWNNGRKAPDWWNND